jgi:hypothetical protein
MDVPNLDTLEQEWKAFLSAPYIIAPLIAGAGVIGWWLRGIRSGRGTDGLRGEIAGLKGETAVFVARLKLADEKVAWANKLKDEAIKAIESKRQFEDLKAGIVANEGSTLAELKAKVDAALEKLLVANDAERSAIATAVRESEGIGIGDKLEAVLIRGNKGAAK